MVRIVLRNKVTQSRAGALRDSAIGTAIARLPKVLRWVMILGDRNGLSTREIATLAGVDPKVIESTQVRGLALVRRELEESLGVAI